LGYIGAKQIALTASEEGEAIGFQKGVAEAKARREKEEMILNLHKSQIPLAIIAISVNMKAEDVKKLIDKQ
jgi:hypothetical protein